MFTLFKILEASLIPSTLVVWGIALGILFIAKRRERWAMLALGVTLGMYYILAIEPTAAVLSWSLERAYSEPVSEDAHRDAVAIVVLGNAVGKAEGYRPVAELSGASWRRLWRATELYRALDGSVPILYVGGSGDPFDRESSEAVIARSYAVTMGIPGEDFFIETTSRTTYENGVAVQRVLHDRPTGPVLLVTSARHVRRATAVFDRLGIATVPIATDFDGGTFRVDFLSFLPTADRFGSSIASLHEWVGLVTYRILGRA